ncbi:hypothetical protein CTAYLR_002809 [Chrysophaeum taylorii]|uniref:RAVE complex protein Rav1 C-terminal domain-containing protein n=1 Tax=Chrysophaeum taylorii TaxID=2483200 RepID=A0AAD7XIZ3_9STRA|nr:hypothetical protein CTAYLR_002809 [Chrysophaeum taylorii]
MFFAHGQRDGVDLVCWAGPGGGLVVADWEGPRALCWASREARLDQVAMEPRSGVVAAATSRKTLVLFAPPEAAKEGWRVEARTVDAVVDLAAGLSVSSEGALVAAACEAGVRVFEKRGSRLSIVAVLGDGRPTSSHLSPSGAWVAAVVRGELVCWRGRDRVLVRECCCPSDVATATRWRSFPTEMLLAATTDGVVVYRVSHHQNDDDDDDDDDDVSLVVAWRLGVSRLRGCAWVECGRYVADAAERDDGSSAAAAAAAPRFEASLGWIVVVTGSASKPGTANVRLVAVRTGEILEEEDDDRLVDEECLVARRASLGRVDALSATALFATDLPAEPALREARCFVGTGSTVLAMEAPGRWITDLSDWLDDASTGPIPHPSRAVVAMPGGRLVAWAETGNLSLPLPVPCRSPASFWVVATWVGDELLAARADGTLEAWNNLDDWRPARASRPRAVAVEHAVALRVAASLVLVVSRNDDGNLAVDAYRADPKLEDVERIATESFRPPPEMSSSFAVATADASSPCVLVASADALDLWTVLLLPPGAGVSHRRYEADDDKYRSNDHQTVAAAAAASRGLDRVAVVSSDGRLDVWRAASIAPLDLERVATLPAVDDVRWAVDVRWAGDDVATVDSLGAARVYECCKAGTWRLATTVQHAVPLSARVFVPDRPYPPPQFHNRSVLENDDANRVARADDAASLAAIDRPDAAAAALAAFLANDVTLRSSNNVARIAWYAPIGTLEKKFLDAAAELARDARAKRQPAARAAALHYVATGRAATLAALAKADAATCDDLTAAKFAKLLTTIDFATERGRNAARNNAFSLLSKRDFHLAAAVFCLADPPLVVDATLVAADKLHDLDLALALARLADHNQRPRGRGDDPRPCGPNARRALRKIILPALRRRGDLAMEALALLWLGRFEAATAVLDRLSKKPPDDVDAVFSALALPALVAAIDNLRRPRVRDRHHHLSCRVSIRAAAVALHCDAPLAALHLLENAKLRQTTNGARAADDAARRPPSVDAAPQQRSSQPPSMLDTFDAQRPPSSMLDGLDAAPQKRSSQPPSMLENGFDAQRPPSMLENGFDAAPQRPPSMLDGFDAAPQRPPSMLENGFDAAPQRPPSMLENGFDAAPQRPPSMLENGFDAAPQRPPSMLDGFDAAPQRPPSMLENGFDAAPQRPPSMLDGFDAAPQRPPSMLENGFDAAPQRPPSMLDGFDAAPQRPPSMLDGFDAAPQRPPSMLDGFDAAPQRPPSMLDGFDAAPQRPPSMMRDGLDAAPQRCAPLSNGSPHVERRQAALPGDEDGLDSGDDEDFKDDTDAGEIELWMREIAIEAAATHLAGIAVRTAAKIFCQKSVQEGYSQLRKTVMSASEVHGLDPNVLLAETLRLLEDSPTSRRRRQYEVASSSENNGEDTGSSKRVRPLVASLLVIAATSEKDSMQQARDFAAFLVRSAARRAFRLALVPSAPAPPPHLVREASNLSDELRACLALSRPSFLARAAEASSTDGTEASEAQKNITWRGGSSDLSGLVGFARPRLVQEVAAARRAAALCCEPGRRELVLGLILRHPPPPRLRRRTGASSKMSSKGRRAGVQEGRRAGVQEGRRASSKGSSAHCAAAAAAIAARHGDVEGWERLQSTDRQGAERVLAGKPLGEFLLRPQQQNQNQNKSKSRRGMMMMNKSSPPHHPPPPPDEESAAVAISFVAAKPTSERRESDAPDASCVQHAIIRVAADPAMAGGIRYTSGKLGPCPTLLSILEDISERLDPHGLLLDGVRRRELDSEALPSAPPTVADASRQKSFSRDDDDDDDDDAEDANYGLNDSLDDALRALSTPDEGCSRNGRASRQRTKRRWWPAWVRSEAALDVLAVAALQQQFRGLCGTSKTKGRSRDGKRQIAASAAIFDDNFSSTTTPPGDDEEAVVVCDDPPGLVSMARASRVLNRRLLAHLSPGILDDDDGDEDEEEDEGPGGENDLAVAPAKQLEQITEGEGVAHGWIDRHEGERLAHKFESKLLEMSFSERGSERSFTENLEDKPRAAIAPADGYVLAQMLHPRSGVALLAPRSAGSWSSGATLVSPSFAPEAAATWLVEHGHDETRGMARARLARWRTRNIVVSAYHSPAQAATHLSSRMSPPPSWTPHAPPPTPTMIREVKSAENFFSVAAAAAAGTPAKQHRIHRHFGGGGGGGGMHNDDDDQGHLRYVDAWEVEPLDEDDASALLRPSLLGRVLYAPIQGDGADDAFIYASPSHQVGALSSSMAAAAAAAVRAVDDRSSAPPRRRAMVKSPWAALRCEAYMATAIAQALPPAARSGLDECHGGDDEALADACSAWPPPPATATGDQFRGGSEPFRARLRRYLYRNALYRRVRMRRRFIALVQVDLVALENITESLLDGNADQQVEAAAKGLPQGAASPPEGATLDAYAVIRLKHARPPGGGSSPPLSERVRTRDSVVTSRREYDDSRSWGAAFRFALPDEALPPLYSEDDGSAAGGSPAASPSSRRRANRRERRRLPTRGPPQAVHVCIYQRAANPILSSLGLAPNETFLGDVEVPLGALTDDDPLVQWLPLRASGPASSWFVKVRVCLRFLLMSITSPSLPPSTVPEQARSPPFSARKSLGFGDDGRRYENLHHHHPGAS